MSRNPPQQARVSAVSWVSSVWVLTLAPVRGGRRERERGGEGKREGGREREREGGRERGREGGRERERHKIIPNENTFTVTETVKDQTNIKRYCNVIIIYHVQPAAAPHLHDLL